MADPILLAQNSHTPVYLLPALANRHGCITGATGTGKTVTLQVLAEAFSRLGTPVFLADAKGDLSGISQAAQANPKLQERLQRLGLPEPVWGQTRSPSGTSLASRAIRFAPRSPTWGRYCSPGFWN